MRRPPGVGIALLATAVLATGCSADAAACTQVAAESGIQITLPRFETQAPRVAVSVCLAGDCTTVHAPTGDPRLRRAVVGGDLSSIDPVEVSVTVRDSSRRLLFRGRTTVTPQTYEPNGHGCDPTVYVGAAHGRGRHTLTAVTLDYG